MERRRYGDVPVSSNPSSVDELMSSLLVWQDGQLAPASSASSQGVKEDTRSMYAHAESRNIGAWGAPASDQSRAAGRPHLPNTATQAPRAIVKDICTPPPRAGGLHRLSADAKREVLQRRTPTSTPCSAKATSQSKLDHTRARHSSQASQTRRTRTKIEAYGIENIPPPSGQMTDSNGPAAFGLQEASLENFQPNHTFNFNNDSKLDLMSIEAWEKENPYLPPDPQPATSRKVIPARLDKNHGKDTQIFNTECQRRGFTHEFRFHEVAKGCFDVELFVEGNQIDRAGPYASKKDAKEAMCRLALGKMREIGFKNVESAGGGRKRKSSDLQSTLPSAPDGIEDENWIHIINSYAQQNKMDYPDYEFSEPEPYKFTCTMGFPDTSLQAFGLTLGPFTKKETAKKAAAMEAVKWLRAEGKLSESSTKRQKPSLLNATSPNSMAIDIPDSPKESLPQQVFDLARQLGFSQPQFHTTKRDGNFVDEHATFMEQDVRYEPRLAGTHGRVERIFGKKAAHQESCRLVLQFLKEIRQARMAG